jgi:hypothetical protein
MVGAPHVEANTVHHVASADNWDLSIAGACASAH